MKTCMSVVPRRDWSFITVCVLCAVSAEAAETVDTWNVVLENDKNLVVSETSIVIGYITPF